MPLLRFPQNEDELNIALDEMKSAGADESEMIDLVKRFDSGIRDNKQPVMSTSELQDTTQTPSWWDRTKSKFSEGLQSSAEAGVALEQMKGQDNELGAFGQQLKRAGGGIKMVTAPLSAALEPALNKATEIGLDVLGKSAQGYKEAGKAIMGSEIMQTPFGQNVAQTFEKGAEKAGELAQKGIQAGQEYLAESPNLQAGLKGIGDITTGLGDVALAGGASKLGKGIAKQASKTFKTVGAKSQAEKLIGKVEQDFFEAFKPSPSKVGKSSNEAKKFYNNVREGVLTMTKEKNALGLIDDMDTPRLPKTILETRDALDNAKKSVFQKYNIPKEQASAAGAVVDLSEISDDLLKASNSTFVKDFDPALGNKVQSIANSLKQRGLYTLDEAQEVVQKLNSELKSFYRNPNPNETTLANIKSYITQKLNKSIDDSVKKMGSQYLDFKKQYGSLRAIEDVVNTKAAKMMSKTGEGLIDWGSNLLTAEALISSISNPANLVKAGAAQAGKSVWKYLTSPDRKVSRMFKNAQKYLDKLELAKQNKNPFKEVSKTKLIKTKK